MLLFEKPFIKKLRRNNLMSLSEKEFKRINELQKRNLVEKLNKIYEPLLDQADELRELKSQAESVINEMEDQISNIFYDLDSLHELILSEENNLAKLIEN